MDDGEGRPSLEVLGKACILLTDGTSQSGLTLRVALLSVLALLGPGEVSRKEICRLLWPDVPLRRARKSLSSLCYSVRNSLGADVFQATRDHLSLAGGSITVDVTEFRAAVQRGEHVRALELYAGPLLDGFAGMDGSPFGQLVDRQRLELELLHERALDESEKQRGAAGVAGAPGAADRGRSRRPVGVAALATVAVVAVLLAVARPNPARPPLEVIVAEFVTAPEDRGLGATASQALQIDLDGAQSVRVVSGQRVRHALERMRRPATSVDEDLALEVARREGVEAVLGGEVRRVGSGFVVITRITSVATGDILPDGAVRVSIPDSSGLIPGIDLLSRTLRSSLGESAESLEQRRPLASVTTSSLPALELFTRAEQLRRTQGDGGEVVAYYDRAIALDSLFASAYLRKAETELVVGHNASAAQSVARAYELRTRLGERDLQTVTGMYRQVVQGDLQGAKAAYERALALPGAEPELRVRAGTVSAHLGDLPTARLHLEAAVDEDPSQFLAWRYLVIVAWLLEDHAEAARLIDDMARRFPGDPKVARVEAALAASNLDLDRARLLLDSLSLHDPRGPWFRTLSAAGLAAVELTAGRFKHALDLMERARDEFHRLGHHHWAAEMEVRISFAVMVYEHRFEEPVLGLRRVLERMELDAVPVADRPYGDLAVAFASARDWASAAEMFSRMGVYVDPGAPGDVWMKPLRVAQFAAVPPEERAGIEPWLPERAGGSYLCRTCGLPMLANESMHRGERDRAIELYRRFLTQGNWGRALLACPASGADPYWLGIALADVGRLSQAAGRHDDAIDAYTRLAELWAEADPPLRRRAATARARADSLRFQVDDRPDAGSQ